MSPHTWSRQRSVGAARKGTADRDKWLNPEDVAGLRLSTTARRGLVYLIEHARHGGVR